MLYLFSVIFKVSKSPHNLLTLHFPNNDLLDYGVNKNWYGETFEKEKMYSYYEY